MKLHLMENRKPYGYTTWGCIWEKGAVQKESGFAVTAQGGTVPSQSRVTAYWPDGSVKWTAHTADSRLLGEQFETVPVSETEVSESGIRVTENDREYLVEAGCFQVKIPKNGSRVLREVMADEQLQVKAAELILQLEERSREGEREVHSIIPYSGEITSVAIEDQGPLQVTFCLSGIHVSRETAADGSQRRVFPFILRETFYYNSPKIDFEHTFLFDGDENRDFLKGLGIRFIRPMEGALYNRHIRFGTDHGSFHEALILLNSWRPRVPQEIYEKQTAGELLTLDPKTDASTLEAAERMPVWSRYLLCQDSQSHFSVRKKIVDPQCCYIEGLHGLRAPGTAAFGDERGGLMLAAKDFWQKYPSGLEAGNLDQEEAELILWLWCPQAEAMDFRHYANQGYSQTYYEGFDVVGATPYGIANTNSFSLEIYSGAIPDEGRLQALGEAVQKAPLYLGEPAYYQKLQAFGQWSLPSYDTEVERFLETQLDQAFDFYKKEIEVRGWYGMFNYGDIMHTYDRFRHCWKYDMGGYAWQNTELVPTLWLWLAFMRSQREDIFTVAEAMSRHCSEVDLYHFGPLKGLGSRHNVRHWGCSCKEARIAMAGHHRFYYYLTGDYRMGDVFEDVKDADYSIVNMDPLRFFYDREKMVSPTHARSGPDWSSFCSNWMTRWERFNDTAYRDKIQVGISDLKKAPLRLTSGTDFEYDPKDGHLRYIGEKAAGGSHLQICMGAPQVWIEMGTLLGDEEWMDMLAEHGRFYYLPREQQLALSRGLIGQREFTLPFMAAGLAAFAADRQKDGELAKTTWRILLHALCTKENTEGFAAHDITDAGNREILHEIPWITTNFTAQWCLNVITALCYIREELPQAMDELKLMMEELTEEGFHKA